MLMGKRGAVTGSLHCPAQNAYSTGLSLVQRAVQGGNYLLDLFDDVTWNRHGRRVAKSSNGTSVVAAVDG